MVRNFKRKTNRAAINEASVRSALTEIQNGILSIRAAATQFNLKKSMLHKRLKKMQNRGQDSGAESEDTEIPTKSKYASNQVFSGEEEHLLNDYLLKCSSMHYGLTYRQTRELAYEYAVRLNKKFPAKWHDEKLAGIDWMKSFRKRNTNISLRKPENTSLARATSFNKVNVDNFFKNYKEVLELYKFEPKHILNLDETGITTVLPCPKVLAEKGKKQVGQMVSAERGQLVTFVGIITANGNALPPAYVFPRVNAKEYFVNGGPDGALSLAHKTGWMTAELFIDVLKHIKVTLEPTKEKPVLLLIDNHESHISISAICFCKENSIVLLSFHPHCSHRLQPLDVGVYGPFKSLLKTSFNKHMAANPGKPISIYDIPALSKQPFLMSFTPHNITKAFEKSGLWPLNDAIFTESDFMSSYVTDRAIPNPNLERSSIEDNATLGRTPIAEPGPSCNITKVTPEVVRPFPKALPRKTTGRKKGKSCIFTNTPEMEVLIKEKHDFKIQKAKKKQVKRVIFPESSSDEETCQVEYKDSSDDEGFTADNDLMDIDEEKLLDDEPISIDDYVLVKFATKKRILHYVAQIKQKYNTDEYDVQFLRKHSSSWNFSFPTTADKGLVKREDVVLKLPKPSTSKGTSRTSSFIEFGICLQKYIFV